MFVLIALVIAAFFFPPLWVAVIIWWFYWSNLTAKRAYEAIKYALMYMISNNRSTGNVKISMRLVKLALEEANLPINEVSYLGEMTIRTIIHLSPGADVCVMFRSLPDKKGTQISIVMPDDDEEDEVF
ncbi:hypothetical protein [Pelistega sp. MC2]|uniref:hypothetical protein n=1 Tax=Pelistega sp. MC2 TaxID=1720297 RepID=UPI0008D9793B|nr:hypothetical protein [Pelistega sp. MC2]